MSVDDTEGSPDRPTREVTLQVNGEEVTAEVEPRLKLSDFLRSHLGLRTVRVGCEHGVCAACTVAVDGTTAKSCMLYAVQAEGSEVTTMEALSEDGDLHPHWRACSSWNASWMGWSDCPSPSPSTVSTAIPSAWTA